MYEGIFMEFCKIMCKKQISKLELETGLKVCSDCKLNLPLDNYNKNYRSCKKCKSIYDENNKVKNSERYCLICKKCNCEFKWWEKAGRRCCTKCVPIRKRGERFLTIQDCKYCGKIFKHHRKRRQCFQCRPELIFWTHELVIETAKTCKTRKEFLTKYDGGYRYAKKRGILDLCYSHMGDPIYFGFTCKHFTEACDRNKTQGLLYLIKCYGNNEIFYKFGITGQGSVEDRYQFRGNHNKHMPYNFEVVWELEGDPKLIYQLEQQKHKETSIYRYQPLLFNKPTLECFKCHGNCKILKKPCDQPHKPYYILLNRNRV